MNQLEYFREYSRALLNKRLAEASIDILNVKRDLGLISNDAANDTFTKLTANMKFDILDHLILAPIEANEHEKWLAENRSKLTAEQLEFCTLSERPAAEVAAFLGITTRAINKKLAEGIFEPGLCDDPKKKRSILTRSVIEKPT
jgi:hypothetical protein